MKELALLAGQQKDWQEAYDDNNDGEKYWPRYLLRASDNESSISSERSYAVSICTPFGSPGAIAAMRAFTPSITSFAFSPERMTTMPPVTSPSPFLSSEPRRGEAPIVMSATSVK